VKVYAIYHLVNCQIQLCWKGSVFVSTHICIFWHLWEQPSPLALISWSNREWIMAHACYILHATCCTLTGKCIQCAQFNGQQQCQRFLPLLIPFLTVELCAKGVTNPQAMWLLSCADVSHFSNPNFLLLSSLFQLPRNPLQMPTVFTQFHPKRQARPAASSSFHLQSSMRATLYCYWRCCRCNPLIWPKDVDRANALGRHGWPKCLTFCSWLTLSFSIPAKFLAQCVNI